MRCGKVKQGDDESLQYDTARQAHGEPTNNQQKYLHIAVPSPSARLYQTRSNANTLHQQQTSSPSVIITQTCMCRYTAKQVVMLYKGQNGPIPILVKT